MKFVYIDNWWVSCFSIKHIQKIRQALSIFCSPRNGMHEILDYTYECNKMIFYNPTSYLYIQNISIFSERCDKTYIW